VRGIAAPAPKIVTIAFIASPCEQIRTIKSNLCVPISVFVEYVGDQETLSRKNLVQIADMGIHFSDLALPGVDFVRPDPPFFS
jgi:hypothetical protein